jgi:hypothetical protein
MAAPATGGNAMPPKEKVTFAPGVYKKRPEASVVPDIEPLL